MRRLFLAIPAAVSFLLLIAVCVLWVRTNWSEDTLTINERHARPWALTIAEGRLTISRFNSAAETDTSKWTVSHSVHVINPMAMRFSTPEDYNIHWSALGFEYWSVPNRSKANARLAEWTFASPLWFVASLLLVLPFLWLRSHRRRQRAIVRAASALCPHCGYDLRPTPVGTCPECGASRWIK